MENNLFKKARYKLTAYYVGIMIIILAIFSSALIHIIELNLRETLKGRIIITEEGKNPIEEANKVIEIVVYSIDGVLLLIVASSSYFLAGKTLRPIKESLDAQKKFSADASHDLRTPLAIITTESEVVLQNEGSQKKDFRDVVKSNLEEAQKMSKLVDDLLLISRGENENAPVFVSVDLHNFIEKIVLKMEPQAKNNELNLEIDEYKKILVKIDQNNFERAISNILQNAIYYTKIGGIKIILTEDGKDAHITISDTGVGISEEELPFVFDRFYKAEHSRHDESGSGLGLPIAKQIIERQGGTIKINSIMGVGSAVSIVIPKS